MSTDVSFCIVTYNQSQFIERAIESVCNQKFSGKRELIIGVDKSNDGTLDVVQSVLTRHQFGGRVKLIAHKENVGACQNYRSVHEAAKGKFIAHLDGDDYFASPDKTQLQLDVFRENANVKVVFTGKTSDHASSHQNSSVFIYKTLVHLLKKRIGGDLHSSKMYRRLPELIHPPRNFLDKEMHLIHSQGGSVAYIDLPLTFYRVSNGVSRNEHLVRRLFLRAIGNCTRYVSIIDRHYLEYMAYASLINQLHCKGRGDRLRNLLNTRLKYNLYVQLKLIKLKVGRYL